MEHVTTMSRRMSRSVKIGQPRDTQRDSPGVFPKGNPGCHDVTSPRVSANASAAHSLKEPKTETDMSRSCHERCHEGGFIPALDAAMPKAYKPPPKCLIPKRGNRKYGTAKLRRIILDGFAP